MHALGREFGRAARGTRAPWELAYPPSPLGPRRSTATLVAATSISPRRFTRASWRRSCTPWPSKGSGASSSGGGVGNTTSLALHLRPDAVRIDRIPPPEIEAVDWDDPDLDFARHSSSGVIGDATRASRDLGARVWEMVVGRVALTFSELEAMSVSCSPPPPAHEAGGPLCAPAPNEEG